MELAVLLIMSLLFFPRVLADSHDHHHHHTVDLTEKYSFKSVLQNEGSHVYTLHWRFDSEVRRISFAVNVSTTGWVGFGLSPNGGMAGADVVIGWVDAKKNTHFHVSMSTFVRFLCLCVWI